MIRTIFTFLICLCAIPTIAGSSRYDNNHILYWDDTSHLEYMLNTDTKEAMLGSGLDDEKAAIHYPPIGDPWWDNMTNLWENIVVASSIEYEGETYIVTKVSNNAFYKSTEVHTIELPETITEIGNYAFGYCTNLERVNIPEGVKSISTGMFYVCKNLTSIHLPSTIETIGSQAFIDCVLLESINIPSNCISVDNDAFSWCLKLSTLTIEDGIKPLNLGYAFSFGPMWQAYMEPFYYPGTFFRGLFNDCPLENLYVGRNIIYDNTGHLQSPFEHCYYRQDDSFGKPIIHRNGKYYKNVTFGNNVTEIHSQLFSNASIPNIILPDSLRLIGDKAFDEAIHQSSLTIPEKCDSIGDNAFASLNGTLLNIDCKSQNPPRIALGTFSGQNFILSVPYGCRDVYKSARYWKTHILCDPADEVVDITLKYANSLYGKLAFNDLEPGDVARLKISGILGDDDWRTIAEMSALYDLDLSGVTCENISVISGVTSNLMHLKFPQGLKVISQELFCDGHLMGTVEIPESCDSIKSFAFAHSPISKLIISGPTVVEERAFDFCKNLKEISISGGAKLLKESFRYIMDTDNPNAGLETLIIGDGVIAEDNSFYYCKHLTNIIFEDQVDSIADGAFTDCNKVENITFNGGIRKLGPTVFKNMSLSRLDVNDVPAWCTMSFSSQTANPMSYAKNIYIEGSDDYHLIVSEGTDSINDYAFAGCNILKSATISKNIKKIGTGSFSYCRDLRLVSLSENIEEIGDSAFAGCISLETVNLPENLPSISGHLFYECKNLTSASIPATVKTIGDNAFYGCSAMKKVEIPHICDSIGDNAFNGCSSFTSLNLPYRLSKIGASAFANCEGLKTVKAFWSTAPVVVSTTFTNINKKCILYVPVGTVPSYYKNGWGRFPLIEEGYSVIYLEGNDYGTISCGDASYKGQDKLITLDINADVSLNVEPNDGFFIKELALDGKRTEPEMHNSVIELQNLTDNHVLSVEYKRYVLGDVNDDDYIDVGDVAAIVKHIQRETLIDFIPVAADTNNDDDIDVGDIRGEVNLIYDYAQVSRSHQLRSKQTVTDNIVRLNGSKMDNSCEYMVDLILNDVASVSGFQIQMILPQGVVVPKDNVGKFDVVFDEEKCAGMNIKSFTQINDSCYQILCAASTLEEIVGGGRVCSIKLVNSNLLDIDQHVLVTMPDIRVADKYGNVVRTSLESLTFGDTTGLTNNFTNSTNATRKLLRNGRVLIVDKNDMYDINGVKVK